VAPSTDLTLHLKLTRWIVLQKARRHRAPHESEAQEMGTGK